MTEELSRTSALASRHTALGSGLEDWNGMGTAWSYSSDPNVEHDAIRESAGAFDMSPLKKVRVTGADAAAALDHLHSRDLTRVQPGQSVYGAVLTDDGKVADDAIAFNNGDDGWLFVHGSGASMELLGESAAGKEVAFELDDDLHIISVQGPASLGTLNPVCGADLDPVPYFHHLHTDLLGHDAMVSRTGYSGERGYELFLPSASVGDAWDQLVGLGVTPASFAALDKVRVEAALLFYGYDMTDEHFPSEVGLGWAISKNGADYRGRNAALAAKGSERFLQTGLVIDHDDAIVGGETVRVGGADVGTVNSPVYSHRLAKSLALGHVAPAASAPGTAVEIVGEDATYTGTIEAIPFFDPDKTRTHA